MAEEIEKEGEEEIEEEEKEETTEEEEEVEKTDTETEEEKSSKKNSEKEEERDYEKELEEEEKKGKPDPNKAKDSFKEREANRKEGEEEDEDKPLTRRDLAEIEDRVRKDTQGDQAFTLARPMATSDAEAKLIVAKWRNRTFPPGMSLQEQLEEAYAVTHKKRLIGQRDEAFRALKNHKNIKTDAAGGHRDGAPGVEPKMSPADALAYKQAGFTYDPVKKLYKKPLNKGKQFLYKDPKTGRQWLGQP